MTTSSPAAPVAGAGRALKRQSRDAAQHPVLRRLVRLGIAARGFVFLVLAYLICRIAFGALGHGGTNNPASGPGVARTVAAQPGGRAGLVALAAGLALYAVFSTLDAILHHDDDGGPVQRWGNRLLSLWGALLYAGFAVYCIISAASPPRGGARRSDQRSSQWSAQVLSWPAGWLWLGLAGVVLVVIGGGLIRRVWLASFREQLDRAAMSPRAWRAASVLGRIGEASRAALFLIVAGFVLAAAVENDPQKGQGVDGSVRQLAASGYGPYLLCAVAAGLLCFGAYLGFEARYRRI